VHLSFVNMIVRWSDRLIQCILPKKLGVLCAEIHVGLSIQESYTATGVGLFVERQEKSA
jgi:hypothetical protein